MGSYNHNGDCKVHLSTYFKIQASLGVSPRAWNYKNIKYYYVNHIYIHIYSKNIPK